MSNSERKSEKSTLAHHLDAYRLARRLVALASMRMQEPTREQREDVSFHAIGIAEAVDRLGMESLR